MQWRIAGHLVVFTGEGVYEPDFFDAWHAIRCIACPGKAWADCNHVLWQQDEEVPLEDLNLDREAIVRSVATHLRSTGVTLPDEVIDAAVMLSGLTTDLEAGLGLMRDRLTEAHSTS